MIAVGLEKYGNVGFRVKTLHSLKGKTESAWLKETAKMQECVDEIWVLHGFTWRDPDPYAIRNMGMRIF